MHSTEGSWFQRILYGTRFGYGHQRGILLSTLGIVEATHAARTHGSDVSEAESAVDEGLWRIRLFDPDTCGASSLFNPVGPWPRSEHF